ncbi:hypothetical protein [Leptospira biflexa]|uniref:hypothetical protein n=1 Tax=Leptospira biflexa TaxID=172 RepID=UPI000314911B|nr:hypothetical protein [Leptospira biflexa]
MGYAIESISLNSKSIDSILMEFELGDGTHRNIIAQSILSNDPFPCFFGPLIQSHQSETSEREDSFYFIRNII